MLLLASLFVFPNGLFAQNDCETSEAKTLPPSFFLSLALEKQIEATRIQPLEKTKTSNEEAIAYFERYFLCSQTLKQPVSPVSRGAKGEVYFRLGQFEAAEREADAAMAIDPNFRDAYILKARIFIRTGEFQKASDYLESNLSRFPDDSEFLFLLGSL
ncbi:hypothetical protein CH375_08320, partial [Leptospira ellisii]